MSKFLKGTFILLIAGLLTRVLGFVNRIVINRYLGEDGVGLYQMAVPTLVLVVTVVQLGLPVAIAKLVAEADAKNDVKKTKKILVVSLSITGGLSLILTPILFLSASFIAENFFTDERIYYPLIALTPIIPIVALSSIIRGYFQGKQNMKPAAVSQVIEQLVRITLIIGTVHYFLPHGVEYAAACAMIASVIGEVASLLYLFSAFKLKKKFKLRKDFFQSLYSGPHVLKPLLNIALPATGSRMIGSISWFLEPIIVSHSLLIAGTSSLVATQQYGLLTGYALPLLLLPSFVTFALSTSLVPAVSEAYAKKHFALVEYRLQQSLKFCMITGGLAVIVLYIFTEPLMNLMYGTTKGSEFIKLVGPLFIFHYYQGPLQAMLQALDLARAAMINSLIGSVFKILVIFAFATQPKFGIQGAALGIACGTVLTTLLHYATVLKKIQFTIYAFDYIKFIFISAVTIFLGLHIAQSLGEDPPILLLLTDIGFICFCYFILLFVVKLTKVHSLHRLARFNPFKR